MTLNSLRQAAQRIGTKELEYLNDRERSEIITTMREPPKRR